MALPLFFLLQPLLFFHENICPYYFMKLKHHLFFAYLSRHETPTLMVSTLHFDTLSLAGAVGHLGRGRVWWNWVGSPSHWPVKSECWMSHEPKKVGILLLPLWWIHVDTWKLSWWTEICPCRRFSVMFSCFDKKTRLIVATFFCLLSTRLLLPSCGFVRFLEFLKVVSFYKKKVKWMCCASTGSKSVEAIDIYR